jgi:hypothetical protein
VWDIHSDALLALARILFESSINPKPPMREMLDCK